MVVEWRRKKDGWRRHFKEKMSQEEADHHRKPWIRAEVVLQTRSGNGEDEAPSGGAVRYVLCVREQERGSVI